MGHACTVEAHQVLQHAAWGVLDATAGEVVATGHVPGITQTIDRAELMALLAALTWGAFSAVEPCLWSDSQSTIHVAEHIQKFDEIPEGASNHDLWHLVQQALRDRAGV